MSDLSTTWAKKNLANLSKKKNNLLARNTGIQWAIDHDPRKAYLLELAEHPKAGLERILDQEENFWTLRARSNWLLARDRNTNVFQTSTLIRGKRNKIEYLKTECKGNLG